MPLKSNFSNHIFFNFECNMTPLLAKQILTLTIAGVHGQQLTLIFNKNVCLPHQSLIVLFIELHHYYS
jgi:hypothetical protein